jgi:hypothetical protein
LNRAPCQCRQISGAPSQGERPKVVADFFGRGSATLQESNRFPELSLIPQRTSEVETAGDLWRIRRIIAGKHDRSAGFRDGLSHEFSIS